jgi:hypothetical protein
MERNKEPKVVIAACIFILALGPVSLARIICVDDDAAHSGDGSSWAKACQSLQDALAIAATTEGPVEVWVAEGIYRPDQGKNQTRGDRAATFQLVNGLILKGGYAGLGAADPNLRNVQAYEAILSGDLQGDDGSSEVGSHPYLWWYLWAPASGRMENSRHVVTAAGIDANAVLDGFTISGGNDDSSESGVREAIPVGRGGGMLNVAGRLTLINCTFSHNSACEGAALYGDRADLVLTGCTFQDNHAYRGGGLYSENGVATLAGCTFIGNSAYRGGAGLYGEKSVLASSHCTFKRNDAHGGLGAAITNHGQSTGEISNSLFVANRASFGAGICNYDSSLTLTNCTFNGNSGAGLACYSADYPGTVDASNCILWDSPQTGSVAISGAGSTIRLSFCDVREATAGFRDACEGIVLGIGNIVEADPCFVDSGCWDPNATPDDSDDDFWVEGDYHLKSQAGRWETDSGSWVSDEVTSLCIDAGDPNSPVEDEPEPNGGRINMGAYGGTAEASKSYTSP